MSNNRRGKHRQKQMHAFQDHLLLPETKLVGWAALVNELGALAPVRQPSCVSSRHVRGSVKNETGWRVFDKRYNPVETLQGQLTFALRREDLDLLVLKRILDRIEPSVIESWVKSEPKGASSRRAWFYYETLTGRRLDIEDANGVTAVNALDDKRYYTAKGALSRRHRVNDNLLGTKRFIPLIRKTETLERFLASNLAEQAHQVIGKVGANLIARAAGFLLLADSRASFEIEGEQAPRNRLERWGRAVLQAGRNPLSLGEILRLHETLIEETRFIKAGLRPDGVFMGERDREGDPLPEFIGARHQDLESIMSDLIAANERMRDAQIDPVLQASATAFAFVYIHPLQDGNGRLHRCLLHHVLAERKFTPPGMVFPVSSVMLERIEEYRAILQRHTGRLMPYIEWHSTADRNVEVTNETEDLYRFFDCTEAAEFLFACVERTIEHDLPREIEYLRRHDNALRRIMERVELPDRLAEDLIRFIRQNKGSLSKSRREKEFSALTDEEISDLESIVAEAFEGSGVGEGESGV